MKSPIFYLLKQYSSLITTIGIIFLSYGFVAPIISYPNYIIIGIMGITLILIGIFPKIYLKIKKKGFL